MNQFHLNYKKSTLWTNLAISGSLFLLTIYVVQHSLLTGAIGMTMFGYKALVTLIDIVRPRPALVISSDGIVDRGSNSRELVPWSSIKSIHCSLQPQVVVVVRNDAGNPAKIWKVMLLDYFLIRKLTGYIKPAFALTPVMALDGKAEDLLNAIRTLNSNKSLNII